MAAIRYLSVDNVVQAHDAIVAFMGGPHSPLIHPDRLEAALHRPHHAAFYEGADVAAQAALLAVAISQSQAFLDGNKRAGFAAADVFLAANGWPFVGNPMDFALGLEAVAEARTSEERAEREHRLADWLRANVVPASAS